VPTPMRVLVITNTYPTPGTPGDTPCIGDQVEALRAHGVHLEVLHIDRRRKWNYVHAAGRVLMLNVSQRRYDLVHAHYGRAGAIARLQARYPLAVTFRGSDLLASRDARLGRLVARLADGVVVMSEEMRQASGRPDARVIPYGVETAAFAPVAQEEARQRLALPLDSPLILFPWDPARRVKRYDLVREAVEILGRHHPGARVVAVHGRPREEIALYMSACDMLILASDQEGAPVAVREALASGLPVVARDVGDVRPLIEGVEGCHICTADPGDIAQKADLVLQRGSRLPAATRQTIGVDRSAEDVLALYATLARDRRVSGRRI
jgi:teichuronic acid biosynthesis glycosyltransferase TuaC